MLPDMTANTPLHWAAETGNAGLVQQLLQFKPQLDMQNLNMCEYSTGQWLVGDDPIMPVDKVGVLGCLVRGGRQNGELRACTPHADSCSVSTS